MEEAMVNGIRVAVRVTGQGEPVVLLHGVPDSSLIWDGVLRRRDVRDRQDADVNSADPTAGFRCFAPDWPGFGRSGPGDHLDCSPDGHANFVRDLADSLGILSPFYLIGHDFGGFSAMVFTAKYPNRVKKLMVSNAPFHPDYRWHRWAQIWRTPGLGEISMAGMNRLLFSASLRKGSRKLSDEHIRATWELISPATKRSVLRMYRALPASIWREWYPKFLTAAKRVPVLVLWGEQDRYLPGWLADRYGALEVLRFEESGHWLPAEEPELFHDAAFRFFQSRNNP